ncbi:hypothetical protein P691DRAFT_681656 [Macrolepiota fuliginosa MF-IS2]|uniref:Uncharacterized protein n=1 Tax=Macrolepiota fuliginosa MF-IS2 TaxID=1400762 RepID=A0A9P5X072_9AGAR|nr:hypothetical protein P691DRAFT_681656 [Macrolepiota fuliginosa MF-IS2]
MGYHDEIDNILPPAYTRLKREWEGFVDNLIGEWKTLNVLSVLLLAAMMTIFQIQDAAQNPITRYLAFWSLFCALLSLLFSCLYIFRFGMMRKPYKAVELALEVGKNPQPVLWNMWVMLSMPLVWVSWSVVTFIFCIVFFMWQSRAQTPEDVPSPSYSSATELIPRILICIVLGTGVAHVGLAIYTFHRYGSQMDESWRKRFEEYCRPAAQPSHRVSRGSDQSRVLAVLDDGRPEPSEVVVSLAVEDSTSGAQDSMELQERTRRESNVGSVGLGRPDGHRDIET